MSYDLTVLYHQHAAGGAAGVRRLLGGEPPARQGPRTRSVSPVADGGRRVVVDAITAGRPAALRSDMRALDLKGGALSGGVVSGRLPIRNLRAVARLPTLRGLLPAYALAQVGSVTSEADTSHSAFEGRAALGVDGSGQKICAMSDSYDQDSTAATSASGDVRSGDLPGDNNPNGYTTPVDVREDYDGTSPAPTDEGRAMLQLIHDIAPGATLGYHTAFNGLAAFADGIRELGDPGRGNCDIIVDDIRYNTQPFYQDGPVANAADDVAASDSAAFFSAAGNFGQDAYVAPFRPSGEAGAISPTSEAHDFDPSSATDTRQAIRVQAGSTVRLFSFQWTDPSALVDGSDGADTDLDIALVDSAGTVLAQSADANAVTGVPVESLSYTNSSSDAETVNLVVEKTQGPAPDSIQYVYTGGGYAIQEYDTLGPTVYGHPAAEGAMAVAAASFFRTAAYNSNFDPAALQDFSSKGGKSILFGQDGNRLASPQDREKPDVTGTDGLDNTFFGSDTGFKDPDPYPNFFGTSAAAPTVAAIAALLEEANSGLSPSEVYARLEANAEDVTTREDRSGDLVPIASGVDPWSGHGFVQADGSALPVVLARFGATTEGPTAVLTWTTAAETKSAGFAVEHRRAGETKRETGPPAEWAEVGFVGSKAEDGTTDQAQSYRFTAEDLGVGTHQFRLRQVDLDGASTRSDPVTVEVVLSGQYQVSAVTPNPVRDGGTVSVAVRSAQSVTAAVYNTLGQRVATLYDGRLAAGEPVVLSVGASLSSGVYFLRVRGESFAATRKFVRVR